MSDNNLTPDDRVTSLRLALSVGHMDPRFRKSCEDVLSYVAELERERALGVAALDALRTPAPPNDELRRAAQAVIDRWDSPKWKWDSHTSEFINALRKALKAAPEPDTSEFGPVTLDDAELTQLPTTGTRYVWLAESTSSVVAFSSKLAAENYRKSFPTSVAGGIEITCLPVITVTKPLASGETNAHHSPGVGNMVGTSTETEDSVYSRCPQCKQLQQDLDGFGVLKCVHCDYCKHASITDGACGFCNQSVETGDDNGTR